MIDILVIICLIFDLELGPSKVIVDMKLYLRAKALFVEPTKQLMHSIENLPPNFRTYLVSFCVATLPGALFSITDACNMAKTYSNAIKLDLPTKGQIESALEYFLQNGLIEQSEKSTMRKLGKGSRSNDFEKVFRFGLH